MEYRDGRQYDFVINNPAILTVEVGEETTHDLMDLTKQSQNYMNMNEIDNLLQQYSSDAEQLKGRQTFENVKHPQEVVGFQPEGIKQSVEHGVLNSQPSYSYSSSQQPSQQPLQTLTLEEADVEKQQLFDRLNQSFQLFLEYVQSQAENYAKSLFGTEHQVLVSPKARLLELLDTATVPIDEWRRKLKEVQSLVKNSERKDIALQEQLAQDIESQANATVGSHVATALNDSLNKQKENFLEDIKAVYETQQYQTNLMQKMSTSYLTFYSWMLEQWNRSIKDINDTYSRVHNKIELLWSRDPLNQDISQMLDRYEKFLQAHESNLPLEFTLTANPRKEWKTFLSKQQPEECIRLMKNELQALEATPALQKSIEVWKRELNRYDATHIQRLIENRQRLKKRIEDAVDIETRQTCKKKWRELNERIYRMGTELQTRASIQFQQYVTTYNAKQQEILYKNSQLKHEIHSYERRLSLVDKPWAEWMEKRKLIIKEWAHNNYWQVSIASFLSAYDILNEFRKYIQTQQEAKLN